MHWYDGKAIAGVVAPPQVYFGIFLYLYEQSGKFTLIDINSSNSITLVNDVLCRYTQRFMMQSEAIYVRVWIWPYEI